MKLITLSCLASCLFPLTSLAAASPPNIIFFFADDLGYGELGVYGQKKIKTPYIDQLAHEGMKFTQFYSGQNVCAPSRCALLTGKHMGHAAIRENSAHLLGKPERYTDPDMKAAATQFQKYKKEDGFPGQLFMPESELTVAEILKKQGYATACIGKWGLGHVSDEGSPVRHGFDLFYGYMCQRRAHNYYPVALWKNDKLVPLPGNDRKLLGETYAADAMEVEALQFIKDSKDKPFFLYYATPVPHVALQVPEDEPSLAVYRKGIRETVMKNGSQTPLKLYNLKSDLAESQDVSKQHPEVVAKLEKLMREAHTPNKMFPMGALEKEY